MSHVPSLLLSVVTTVCQETMTLTLFVQLALLLDSVYALPNLPVAVASAGCHKKRRHQARRDCH